MKLKEWADKTGVKYLTAYRWFKDGSLPVKAYQTGTGTIIVDDSEVSNHMNVSNNDAMALFLKKTVEYSKSNSSIEDFAAYIISNFNLKLNIVTEPSPKYSRNKPKAEDVQKHFQQFLKPKGEKPSPNMFVDGPETIKDLVSDSADLTTEDVVQEISKIGARSVDSFKFSKTHLTGAGGSEQVDLNSLQALLNSPPIEPLVSEPKPSFVPTQKELEQADKLIKSKNIRKRKNSNNKNV